MLQDETITAVPEITLVPIISLIDEIVHITVKNLQPGQNVFLKSHLNENGNFYAEGNYIADKGGNVDCMTMVSNGGSYTGVEPMGLVWSLKPEAGYSSGWRIRKKDVTLPHVINLSVLDSEGCVLSVCVMEKYYKSNDVLRISVHHGRIRGTLFIPNNGLGKYQAIMDLYGSTGGLPEYRAAILSSRGFLVLALAYSQYEDLPKDLSVDLEYFEEAIDFLTSHKNSLGNNEIGIISISYGATLAMDIAIISKKVKAVVLIGGPFFRNQCIKYRGENLPYSPSLGIESVTFVDNMVNPINIHKVAACTNPASVINLHKAKQCSFLIFNGTDDQNNPAESALQIAQNLTNHDHSNYSFHLYSGAGHLIEPPYIPFAHAYLHRIAKKVIISGGNAVEHSHAQEQAWKQILEYFRSSLSNEHKLKSHL